MGKETDKGNREYRSTVFSKLFSEPERIRELYNALAGTDYGEDVPVEINTLEDVFFNDMKNDVSFTIGGRHVILIEHQSTVNPNIPLRCLMYIAKVYEKIVAATDSRAVFRKKLLKIPAPEFVVFYNGRGPCPEDKTLRLSDAYIAKEGITADAGSLDLTVRVLNIKTGYNEWLKQRSESLLHYEVFIERVDGNIRRGYGKEDAINEAIKWAQVQGVLAEFIAKYGSEVHSMLMTEFNIDIAREVWQEEAREEGFEEGLEQGREEARAELTPVIAEKDATLAEQADEIARLRGLLEQQTAGNS